jgi:hypothetical protein
VKKVVFPWSCCALLAFSAARGESSAPATKQETATARRVMVRPGAGGVFAKTLRNFRRQDSEQRPFEWREVDEKIDDWFLKARTHAPEDFQKHRETWDELRAETRRQARVLLAPVEQAWKDSVHRAADAFRRSEDAFYDGKPTFVIKGRYRYLDGQRERSSVDPAWKLDPVLLQDAPAITGRDTHDSGALVIRAAGLDRPIVSLQCVWTVSVEASVDPESLDVLPVGRVNTPVIDAWLRPNFEGKTHRKTAVTWGNFDGSSTPIVGPIKLVIGDSRLSTSSSVDLGFTYPALDFQDPMPTLHAGR